MLFLAFTGLAGRLAAPSPSPVTLEDLAPRAEPYCGDPMRRYRTYCHPWHYQGLANHLYCNNGDGTFADVSEAAGASAHIGKGMSTNFADLDQDGLPDVLVTNDTTPGFLFRERHPEFGWMRPFSRDLDSHP